MGLEGNLQNIGFSVDSFNAILESSPKNVLETKEISQPFLQQSKYFITTYESCSVREYHAVWNEEIQLKNTKHLKNERTKFLSFAFDWFKITFERKQP